MKRLEAILFKHADRFRFAAIVLEDPGFRGAAVRAILAMLGILHGKRHPEGFFSRIDEAVAWMRVQRGAPEGAKPAGDELASAVSELRSIHRGRAKSHS